MGNVACICSDDKFHILSLGGDFLSFLRKKKEDLKTKQLVKFALDAAAGMAYLELKNCIHRYRESLQTTYNVLYSNPIFSCFSQHAKIQYMAVTLALLAPLCNRLSQPVVEGSIQAKLAFYDNSNNLCL